MKSPFEGGKFRLTSPYGARILNGVAENHGGVDLVGISGKNIVAVCSGTVAASNMITDKTNLTWQWGNYVCVHGDDGKYYYYCHMQSRAVEQWQTVKAGDILGVEGNTGYSLGSHLHFEVRAADGTTKINAADILGIPNTEGVYEQKQMTAEDYIRAIVSRVGYDQPEPVIQAFLKVQHPYILDVWRKLYEAL